MPTPVRHVLRHPALILIMGVAGVGKSTLSKRILKRLSAVYLDNNQIVDAFFPKTRTGRAYRKLRPAFYRALYTIAEENLRCGNSVLLDVPHIKEAQTAQWTTMITRLAARGGAKLIAVRCTCPEELLRSRLKSRGEPRDRWKLQNWAVFAADQPLDATMRLACLEIDTSQSPARNTETVLRHIIKASR
jgi:predicted kinase